MAPLGTIFERRIHRRGLTLATLVAVLGATTAVLSNLPDKYNPDHLRSSRLSSVNLNKCNPGPSICITLGNGERFKFQGQDSEAALQWMRNRIDGDYSEAVGTLYRQSFVEGRRDLAIV